MMASQPALTSPDGSSNGSPPERCPRPLYSLDSTQEDLTIPHHHQGKELKYIEVKINKEEEETNLIGDQQSMEEGGPLYLTIPHHHQGKELNYIKVEVKEEEEETCLMGDPQSMEEGGPLYSWDSTQEGLTIPHHHQGEKMKDIKVEVKEEEEETLVSGDQPSMEEEEMIVKTKREESPLHMDTKEILKDSFRHRVNKAQAAACSGAAAPPKSKKPHPYASQLHFLRPSIGSRDTTSNWSAENQELEAEQSDFEVEASRTPSTLPNSEASMAFEVVTPQGSVRKEAPVRDSSPSPVPSSRRGHGRGRGRQQRQSGAIEESIVNLLRRSLQKERPSPLSNPNNPQAAFCTLMFHTLSDLSAERSKQAMDSIVTFLAACRSAQRSGLPSPMFHTETPIAPTPAPRTSVGVIPAEDHQPPTYPP